MNPLAVRLTAGGVTILLGALAAAQAQKDGGTTSDSTWTVPADGELESSRSLIAASRDGSPSLDFPAGPDARPAEYRPDPSGQAEIALVGHADPVDDEASSLSAAGPAFSMPQFAPAPDPVAIRNATARAAQAAEEFLPPPPEYAVQADAGEDAFAGDAPDQDAATAAAAPSQTPAALAMPTMDLGLDQMADAVSAETPAIHSSAPPTNGLRSADPPSLSLSGDAADPPQPLALASDSAPSMRAPGASQSMQTGDELPGGSGTGSDPQYGDRFPAPDQYAPDNQYAPAGPFASSAAAAPASRRGLSAAASSVPPAVGSTSSGSPTAFASMETIPTPGDRRLEGAQSPSVLIQKRAPTEVKVGKPATFAIQVRNVGSVEALNVQVHDQVPQGMELADSAPQPEMDHEGRLLWSLGSLEPGGERTITMQLIPREEGELGSVARVTFEAAASVRTVSTRPQLNIVQHAPPQVLIGQQVEIELEISNPGTGVASAVVVRADVPEGFEHPKGRELDNLIGDLQPGEVRREYLRLRATAPGMIRNLVQVVGEDGLTSEHAVDVQVIAPELQVGLSGPSRRYLERQATYEIDLANVGSAAADNVQVIAHLDRGFQYISTENMGQYDPSRHAVFWSLNQLPAGQQGVVKLTLLPVEEGDQAIRLEARSDLGGQSQQQSIVQVQSLAELSFQIRDTADPIEQGGETVYEIQIDNSGSRNDSNVQVMLQLPRGVELIAGDGGAQYDDQGNVYFAPIANMAAGESIVYRVRVRGTAAGRHLIKAVVQSDQSDVPVSKEESTMVYADQ